MKNGTWKIVFEIEGTDVTPSDLSDATLEHIAKQVEQGFVSGEIVEHDEGENEQEG